MNTSKKILLALTGLIALSTPLVFSWGFFAHQRINRMAVFCLPEEMFGFFKHHIDYLTVHATDPDRRRYAVEGEAACHYIDLDRYGEHPFDSLPKRWNEAVAKIGEDTLMAHGIVPWHIQRMMYRLTAAFRDKDFEKILHNAADLGHYVADAHVPLHCTRNYNGQLTGQHGIHAFWESRLPELFIGEFDFLTGRCRYLDDPLAEAWHIVGDSYRAQDSVLKLEKQLSEKFPADRKYAYEQKGNTTIRIYSREYSLAYHRLLKDMVERRMRESVYMTASLWYTAWINAGQPDLNILSGLEISHETKEKQVKEELEWNHRKIQPKGHEEE